jgi:hypothetical protein
LESIIARTLARNPRERFQTAAELADALQRTGLAARHLALQTDQQEATPTTAEATFETPTRVDHPAGSGGANPPPRPGPGGRIVPFLITAPLILVGLMGLFARTPASPLKPCPCETVEKEKRPLPPDCEPPCEPQ